MDLSKKDRRNILLFSAFVAPNIVGFLIFACVPLVFSLAMAFTDWDLTLHNMFKEQTVQAVQFENFSRLFNQPDFWRFLGNTLFFMMTIPFSVAGSLVLALLLTRDLRGGHWRVFLSLICGVVFVACVAMMAVLGSGGTGMFVVLSALGCGILVFGVLGGTTFYRTLFFLPHFCAGVATFILWKKLYNPHSGPINQALYRPLEILSSTVNSAPASMTQAGLWLCYAAGAALLLFGAARLLRLYQDGELGMTAAVLPVALLLTPSIMALFWTPRLGAASGGLTNHPAAWIWCAIGIGMLGWRLAQMSRGREYSCEPSEGLGDALMLALALLIGQCVFLGLGIVFHLLPSMAADGLMPPNWISSYHWAKPSLMIMALWGAIGSNNMLLYIAALSNVPPELYEAADIDGASSFQRFWHITWPQLAPTTFFIGIMATIHGLRGGFEIARTMTEGGPAGSTKFLSYFIFAEGFETGRLGYSSAIAWTLFAMTFALTLFNWRFGNRYVND